jgi:peptidoglycan biosynthesis protein MviN/MurJ (putative lipid II flippase)
VPLAWLCVSLLLGLKGLGLDDETRNLARLSLNYLVFLIPLGLAVNYGSVLMMGRGRHANSLFEGAPALVLLLLLLLWVGGGIEALLWGTVAGTAVQLGITVLALRRGALLRRPRLAFTSPAWVDFRAGVGVMLLAQSVLALTTVVDQFFAAGLGSGSISALGYATRILALFLALGSTAIGRATLPVFSRLRHSGSDSLFRLAKQWTIVLFFVGAAVALVGCVAAEWMVRLLFERGAFTPADTVEVSYALRWGLLQLPFTFAMMAASQLLFSVSRHWLAAVLAVSGLSLKVALNFALIPHFGIAGLLMSTAAMQGFSCLVLLYVLRPRAGGGTAEDGSAAI